MFTVLLFSLSCWILSVTRYCIHLCWRTVRSLLLESQAVFVQDREIEGVWCPDILTAEKSLNDLWLIHFTVKMLSKLQNVYLVMPIILSASVPVWFTSVWFTAVSVVVERLSVCCCFGSQLWVRPVSRWANTAGRTSSGSGSGSGPAGSGSDWTSGLQCSNLSSLTVLML